MDRKFIRFITDFTIIFSLIFELRLKYFLWKKYNFDFVTLKMH